MNQFFSNAVKLLSLTVILFASSCKKDSPDIEESKNYPQSAPTTSTASRLSDGDFQELADTLEHRLKYKCVGYSFIVSYMGHYKTSRSWGQSRHLQDLPEQPFTMYTKYSIASVTKTITATALIKKLCELPGGINNLDMPVWTYLPAHWQFGPNFKTITFRQLLAHTSGIRDNNAAFLPGDDYQTLKTLVSKGINLSNKVYSYNNRNYALMRLLIPKLAQYNIVTINGIMFPGILAILENTQAIQFAEAYKDYCRQVIFNKLGTTATQTIDCVNTDTNPGLCYTFPINYSAGIMCGDLSSIAGGQGWVLNTVQVNDFFTTLLYTQTLLPYSLSQLMKNQDLGYNGHSTTNDGIGYFWKQGNYDFPTASYRSLIMGFSDDIQITMMVNSGINIVNETMNAHQDWHP